MKKHYSPWPNSPSSTGEPRGLYGDSPNYLAGGQSNPVNIDLAEIERLKEKAAKWDALEKKIAKFYEGANGEAPEIDGDLGAIGECAASAFGYL
jgi:hypothetical protein